MNKISRKGFLKIAAAAAMSGVTAGALAACNSASGSTASGAAGQYIPGTYEGTAEGISSTVKVTMTFSDSAVTDVVWTPPARPPLSALPLPMSCVSS